MSFTPNFTATTNQQSPTVLSIVDTSDGVAASVTSKRVYLLTPFGTYLKSGTTYYNDWVLSSTTLSLPVLDRDYALLIRVEWLNGSTVVYSKEKLIALTTFSKIGFYAMTQLQNIKAATITFYKDKLNLKIEMDNAYNAVLYGNDITSAQSALNRASVITAKYIKS